MTIREETEAIERQTLSRYATLSENSLGRRVPLEPDPGSYTHLTLPTTSIV